MCMLNVMGHQGGKKRTKSLSSTHAEGMKKNGKSNCISE